MADGKEQFHNQIGEQVDTNLLPLRFSPSGAGAVRQAGREDLLNDISRTFDYRFRLILAFCDLLDLSQQVRTLVKRRDKFG
jgi:hypothetical protein